ncbi:cellulose-binding protein [Phormidium nigroviride]
MTYFNTKNILTFLSGLLIFIFILPGCLSLAKNQTPTVNNSPNTIAINSSSKNPNSTSPVGVNLSGIADWSTELPFLDAFKSSRKWMTQCDPKEAGCQGELDTKEYNLLNLDENGWVKSLPLPQDSPKYTRVSTLLLRDIPNFFPSGKYIVMYEGEGKIEYKFAAKKDEASSQPGRDIIDVDATNKEGILLTITATDPNKTGKYIRNIRVIHSQDEKAYESGEIFNPKFIDKIKKFRTLRFMDWMSTNGSEQKEWSNRPKPENISYAYQGNVPIEIMVALANKIKANAWFNMPIMATDEYLKNFAQTVKNSLDPNLKVYVELSNEVWNFSFPQSQYALQQGQARWGKDKQDAYMQWYGMRTAQMCDLWKDIFSEQKDRVVCVISTQTAWKGLENSVLDCSYWVAEGNKPCYQHGIDVYAITGYFSGNLGAPENTSIVESWLNDSDGGFSKAFKQLRDGGLLGGFKDSLSDGYGLFKYHSEVAQKKGLKLVAYEGGQHIVGIQGNENNEKLTNFFIELNRRPEMYELYTKLLENWKEAGGTLFMQYLDIGLPSRWGSWGALEYVGQNGSPKYNALMDFIDKNPCWWDGCVLTFPAKS